MPWQGNKNRGHEQDRFGLRFRDQFWLGYLGVQSHFISKNKGGKLLSSHMPKLNSVSEFETDSVLAKLVFCRGGYVWLATRVQAREQVMP
jgi:hypothetical protein